MQKILKLFILTIIIWSTTNAAGLFEKSIERITFAMLAGATTYALGRMFTVASKIAEQEGLDKGYRLLVNCKEHALQEVYHLHMHLFGGEPLGHMLPKELAQ